MGSIDLAYIVPRLTKVWHIYLIENVVKYSELQLYIIILLKLTVSLVQKLYYVTK